MPWGILGKRRSKDQNDAGAANSYAPAAPPSDLFNRLRETQLAVVGVIGERGSGKSLLANLMCRQSVFPLEQHAYGLVVGGVPLEYQEVAEMHGYGQPVVSKQKMIFAEHGTDGAPDADGVLRMMRVSTVVVFNVLFDPDPFNFLQRWFHFAPVLSATMQDRNYGQLGDLIVVVRDWDDNYNDNTEDYSARLWNYEQMPNVADSSEEQRNVIRYHVNQIFRSVSMHFLPMPVASPQHLKSRVFQTKFLVPDFTRKFQDLTFDVIEKCGMQRFTDSGAILNGKHVAQILEAPYGDEGMPEPAHDRWKKAMHELHEKHATINYSRHAQHLKELVEYHVKVPMAPDQLDVQFNDLVLRVQDLLEKLFHVSTQEDIKSKLVADLWNEARGMLEELRKKNTSVTETRIQEAVNMAVTEVEKN